MAIEVAKVELKTVQDASGLEELIAAGEFGADEVVAVIGKTEGNGGVNDFTRILADQAFRRVLQKRGTRSEAAIHDVPMVWSGGCDGVITPHATVFARNAKTGPADKSRLVMGTALSVELLPEDIGRPAMVQKVADAVKAAMKDAGITDPKDVHYVQTKTPLLTIDSVRDAEQRHQTVACEVHDSMGVSNGTTALGIAVALGELPMPKAEQICKDLDLYSSVASCSSGVELTQAQIVLLGNKAGAGGRYRIGHAVMRDALTRFGNCVYALYFHLAQGQMNRGRFPFIIAGSGQNYRRDGGQSSSSFGLARYGGDDGLTIQKRSQFIAPINLSNKVQFYYICLALLCAAIYLVWRIVNSRFGMAIQGARSNDTRMRAIGFPTYRYKLICFVIAGTLCGLAGALLANHTDFVSPAMMYWTRSGDLIIMVVLGGMGSTFGPLFGAVALLVLEEVLSGITEYWQIILGPLLLLVVLFARGGIDGLLGKARHG